jgi:hypothetical protein
MTPGGANVSAGEGGARGRAASVSTLDGSQKDDAEMKLSDGTHGFTGW